MPRTERSQLCCSLQVAQIQAATKTNAAVVLVCTDVSPLTLCVIAILLASHFDE